MKVVCVTSSSVVKSLSLERACDAGVNAELWVTPEEHGVLLGLLSKYLFTRCMFLASLLALLGDTSLLHSS